MGALERDRASERPSERMRWEDGVIYGRVLGGIYLLVGVLFFYAGKEKLFDGLGAPPPIAKQFEGTFLNTIPGIDAAWTILGVLEFLVFVLMVGENEGVAELFLYAGATGVLLWLVLMLPPYRPPNWISDWGTSR
jgi:hypothetical protein